MKRLLFCCMLIGVISIAEVRGQDTLSDSAAVNQQMIDDLFEEKPPSASEHTPAGLPAVPRGVDMDDLDEQTRQKYYEALRGHFQYRIEGYEHRQKVFRWQLFSAKVIFVVVILLVAAGIWFSWVQFRSFLKMKEAGMAAEAEVTELEASAKGIKVSSPVLGVIILVVSLLFFYLYLVYVYPIEEIF